MPIFPSQPTKLVIHVGFPRLGLIIWPRQRKGFEDWNRLLYRLTAEVQKVNSELEFGWKTETASGSSEPCWVERLASDVTLKNDYQNL